MSGGCSVHGGTRVDSACEQGPPGAVAVQGRRTTLAGSYLRLSAEPGHCACAPVRPDSCEHPHLLPCLLAPSLVCIVCGKRCKTVGCPSVRLSVCPIDRQQRRRPASLPLRSGLLLTYRLPVYYTACIVCGKRRKTVGCLSVRLYVCPVYRQQRRRPASLLLRSGLRSIYRSVAVIYFV